MHRQYLSTEEKLLHNVWWHDTKITGLALILKAYYSEKMAHMDVSLFPPYLQVPQISSGESSTQPHREIGNTLQQKLTPFFSQQEYYPQAQIFDGYILYI